MKKYLSKVNISTLILFLVFIVIPLTVKIHFVKVTGSVLDLWGINYPSADSFFYAKSRLVIATGILALIGLLLRRDQWRLIGENYSAKLIIVFSFFIVASTIGSSYFEVALFGVDQRYEGMIVYLSYILIFFAGFMLIEKKDDKRMIAMIAVVALVMAIIGVFQYVRIDPFKQPFVQMLILGFQKSQNANVVFDNISSGRVYGTFGNENYIGSFGALIIPLLLIGFREFDKIWQKSIIVSIGLVTCILVLIAQSSAGIVALIGASFIYFILRIRHMKRNKMILFCIAILALSGLFKNQIFGITSDILDSINDRDQYTIESIRADQYDLKFDVSEEMRDFTLRYDPSTGDVKLIDDNGINVDLIKYGNVNEFFSAQEDYQFFSFGSNRAGLHIEFNQTYQTMFAQNDAQKRHIYKYYPMDKEWIDDQDIIHILPNKRFIRNNRKIIAIKDSGMLKIHEYSDTRAEYVGEAENFLFKGYEHIGSSRGYIWSRSLPLIKDTLIIGQGPDVFAYFFPQRDVLGKLNYLNYSYLSLQKPHSTYMQIAINIGLSSLIILLSSLGLFFIKAWKRISQDTILEAIFYSLIAYWITAFFNDSIVAVAPMFWLLFGYGLSRIRMLEIEELEKL